MLGYTQKKQFVLRQSGKKYKTPESYLKTIRKPFIQHIGENVSTSSFIS